MSHYKPDPSKNINLIIDNVPVTVPEGTRLLEAAHKAGVYIPTLCDCPDLQKRSVCRLCVVENKGRGKLIAACAIDVEEGMNIVTNNARIVDTRKMIVELLLANHPQECLTCVRSGDCELQSLAARFGIRSSSFRREAASRQIAQTENGILGRDMAKCVKCGRCVAVCREVETVRAINTSCRSIHYQIAAPYGNALADGPCTFCGKCAAVCPVGAIYEHDQTAEAWAVLNGGSAAVEIAPALCDALCGELSLPPGSVTVGTMVTALKRLGFGSVFDSACFSAAAAQERRTELLERKKTNRGALPLISGCTPGIVKFAGYFYPDLLGHFSVARSPRQIFGAAVAPGIATVFIAPCIAGKLEAGGTGGVDIVLTVRELARMLKLAGIELRGLPETPFDRVAALPPETGAENEAANAGTLLVNGLVNARMVFDSIRAGKCSAEFVEIANCPGGCA